METHTPIDRHLLSLILPERLRGMGHADVREVRIGRVIDLVIDAPDDTTARARIEELCRALLANPVIETWDVEIAPEEGG